MELNDGQRDTLFDVLIGYYTKPINEETKYNLRNDIKDYLMSIGKRDFDIDVELSDRHIILDLHPHTDDTDLTLKITKQSTII